MAGERDWSVLPWSANRRDQIGPVGPSVREMGGAMADEDVPNWYWDQVYKVPHNPQTEALFRQLGFTGNATSVTDDPELGQQVRWSPEARRWMLANGISEAVAHDPGTSPGGRPEYYAYVDKDGKYLDGQYTPTTIITDTAGEIATPFMMLAPAFLGAAGAIGSAAGGGSTAAATAAGEAAASPWAQTIAELSQSLPGAVTTQPSLLQVAGQGALRGAGMGAVQGLVTGQNPLESALKGALTGAAGGAVSGGNLAGQFGVSNPVGQGLINGAVTGAANSLASGKSVLDGVLAGAAGGGIAAYNPAGALGVENKGLAGAINGAAGGALTSLIRGRDIADGALAGGISGGVSGLNPGGALTSNAASAGLINRAIAGLVQGKDPAQLLAQLGPGALKAAGSALMSGLADSEPQAAGGGYEGFDGGYDEDAFMRDFMSGGGGTGDAMDEEDYGGFTEDDWQSVLNEALSQNQAENQSWLDQFMGSSGGDDYGNEGRAYSSSNPSQIDAGTNSPVNGDVTGGQASWLDTWLSGLGLGSSLPNAISNGAAAAVGGAVSGAAGGLTGTGKTGSTLFDPNSILGSLFGGIQGKDVLGMLGSGISAAMLERQADANREFQQAEAQKNRDFQLQLRDSTWARDDQKETERRARMKPVGGPGLIRAQISKLPGGIASAGVGG